MEEPMSQGLQGQNNKKHAQEDSICGLKKVKQNNVYIVCVYLCTYVLIQFLPLHSKTQITSNLKTIRKCTHL